jgi:O-antigen ligase
LIPLPPWLWTALPNREVSAEAFHILGQKIPWMPISVSPHATWLSFLSLLVPLGVFIGTLLLGYRERRWLSLVILAVGVLSAFLGLLQVAQGPGSSLRFYYPGDAEAVGFFANRDHFAALLYCVFLFSVAWAVQKATGVSRNRERHKYDTASVMALVGAFTVVVILLAGEAMTRSRAGIGLTMVALCAAFALGFSRQRFGGGRTFNKLLFGAVALVMIFSAQFALYRIGERFADPLQGSRPIFARTTIAAASAYMPSGSGLGTFVPVYGLFQKPEDTVDDAYVNRAHNDPFELWLEAGVLGLALMGLFVFWLVRRSVEIWWSAPAEGANDFDWSLARAATIVVALLLAHSLVDFPLRTGAMMAVMAFACAFLCEPLVRTEGRAGRAIEAASKRAPHRDTRPKPAVRVGRTSTRRLAEPSDVPSVPPDQRWGTDMSWPKEWSQPSKPHSAGSESKPPNASKPRKD